MPRTPSCRPTARGRTAGSRIARCSTPAFRNRPGTGAARSQEFEASRKPNADAIADLALEHFHELRDFVGSSQFLLRKEVERWVNGLYPDRYAPLYSLISFTNVPYVEARRLDCEQRQLVDQLLAIPNVRERLGSPDLQEPVDRFMARFMAEAPGFLPSSVPGRTLPRATEAARA